jgi:hypothetical protein
MRLSAVRLSDESAPGNRAGMRLEDAFRWARGLRIRGPLRRSPTGRGVRGEGELVGEADQLLGLQFGERCPELVFGAGTVVAAAEERDQGRNSSASVMRALRGQGTRSASGGR